MSHREQSPTQTLERNITFQQGLAIASGALALGAAVYAEAARASEADAATRAAHSSEYARSYGAAAVFSSNFVSVSDLAPFASRHEAIKDSSPLSDDIGIVRKWAKKCPKLGDLGVNPGSHTSGRDHA